MVPEMPILVVWGRIIRYLIVALVVMRPRHVCLVKYKRGNMWMSEFTGNMPERNLNQPDKKSWEKDMEEEKTCDRCRFKNKSMSITPCSFCPYSNPPFKYYEPIPSPEGEPDDEKA